MENKAMTSPQPSTQKPRISVVMPLYNKQDYVEASLRSVLAQGAWLHDLIVVDDGSTDGGAEVVARLMRDDPRIKLLRQANAGVSAARNRGILACEADYVAFLDADDLYLPGFLQEIANLIQRFPQAGLFATAYRRFTGAADPRPESPEAGVEPFSGIVRSFFSEWTQGAFIFTSSICVRRQGLLDLGAMFPVGERLGEDQDVWFRLAERYPVAYSARPLALYRVDVASSLTASVPLTEVLPCYVRLAERIDSGDYPARHLRGARRLLASHYINIARMRATQGDFAGAWRLLADRHARGNASYWLRTSVWSVWRQALASKGAMA
ncbi:MAG TPA: glycosyltransferase family A protein [Thiobacillus sp.]